MAIMTNSALPGREIDVPDVTVWIHEKSGWVVKDDSPWVAPEILPEATPTPAVDALPEDAKRK